MSIERMSRPAMVGLTLAAIFAAPAVRAQEPGTGWLPWIGCWQAVTSTAGPDVLCVVPSGQPDEVEMVSVQAGAVTERQRVDATGGEIARSEEGCNGWERATWSADGRRIYVRSEFACEGGTRRSASGVLTFVSGSEWLDVQVVRVGAQSATRVVRYRPSTLPLPAELEGVVPEPSLARNAARADAAAPLTVAQIIDASANLHDVAVEAWIAERGDPLALDAEKLVQLSDAGVPDNVIDMVVATAYPETFSVDRAGGDVRADPRRAEDYAYPGYRDRPAIYVGGWDPFFYSYGYGRYSYYSPFGYGRYGNFYRRPVIIVNRGFGGNLLRGNARVINGRGYTQRTGSATGSAISRSTGSTSTVGSASSGSTSSRASTGRRAKPRTGGGGG